MIRILVTGAHGFIGTAFCTLVGKKFTIIPVARETNKLLPRADILVHLAARTAKSKNDASSQEMYKRDNVLGTKKLLRRLSSTPSYVLYVSTMDVVKKPLTAYAQSKLEAEKVILDYCTKHQIPFGIARLGSVYGPGEGEYAKVIPTFIRDALAGKKLTVADPKVTRRFMYIHDVAKALADCVQKRSEGIIPIVGSTDIPIGALAKRINTIIHASPKHPDSFDKNLRREIEWFRKQRVIFFDIDGTIIDHWERMYGLYARYFRRHGFPIISKSEYRQKKREGMTDAAMLRGSVPDTLLHRYVKWKRRPIETRKALIIDWAIPEMEKVLKRLFQTYRIVAVTGRQSDTQLRYQLKKFGIREYFDDTAAVGYAHATKRKQDAIQEYLDRNHLHTQHACLVGDTEMEITAAAGSGIRSISITWGIRNEGFLRTHGASEIAHTPRALLKKILSWR